MLNITSHWGSILEPQSAAPHATRTAVTKRQMITSVSKGAGPFSVNVHFIATYFLYKCNIFSHFPEDTTNTFLMFSSPSLTFYAGCSWFVWLLTLNQKLFKCLLPRGGAPIFRRGPQRTVSAPCRLMDWAQEPQFQNLWVSSLVFLRL